MSALSETLTLKRPSSWFAWCHERTSMLQCPLRMNQPKKKARLLGRTLIQRCWGPVSAPRFARDTEVIIL
jgi:hypothetical protein